MGSWLGRNKPLSPESVSYYLLFPHGSVSKESACMWETQARSLGREDSLQEGHGNPLQYSCLENSLDRGAWWVTVHGGRKESDMTEQLTHTHTHTVSHGQAGSLEPVFLQSVDFTYYKVTFHASNFCAVKMQETE